MGNDPTLEVFATSEEINPVIERIEDALRGCRRDHALIAVISMSIALMNPDISIEKLAQALKDVSQFICMVVDDPEANGDVADPKILMN